ncbi:DUF2190 family protein [Pelagimonas varians]|uniref:DUF2190 family protein n=1 Tax=Pelagimonas varians TaxID=696760 RepID=A0A238KDR9_9RHOB|nr:DUF2190 family protein [Pelagimonas varians]PYG29972.1 putative RecA/RadA family phage recombinase [Pelagimonas varians]SMX40604.1 hypothetical protein PEV8663_02057 [Pelagimonas varians]
MKNYIQPGGHLTLAAPRILKSGEGALVGDIFGVAQAAAQSGEDTVLIRHGVFELAKSSAQAWTRGAKIYWDNTNFRCTTAASGNTLIGAATAVANNPSDTGRVLLDGVIR